MREWEAERERLLIRLRELETGKTEASKILAEARKQLWRLRDALGDNDEEAQAAVVREVISKVEVRFNHERTHGRRSATGTGMNISKATGATVYVRPGLGLSCLDISNWRSPARVDERGRANSCRRACGRPG